jgi:hypothetical protein
MHYFNAILHNKQKLKYFENKDSPFNSNQSEFFSLLSVDFQSENFSSRQMVLRSLNPELSPSAEDGKGQTFLSFKALSTSAPKPLARKTS